MRAGRVSFLCLILFFVIIPSPAHPAVPGTQEELNRAADAFYGSTAIDESAARTVQNVTIKKDFATFVLESGTLYPAKPVEGVVASAVFVGKGKASIEPIRPMDKECLNRSAFDHLNKQMGGKLEATFSEMVIVSMDQTLEGLLKNLPAGSGQEASRASSLLKDRLDQIKGREEDITQGQKPLDISLVQKLTGAVTDGPLILQLKSDEYGWLQFTYDLMETYEFRLASFEKVGAFDEERPLIVTHRASDLDAAGNVVVDALADQKDQIDVQKYVMEITIPDTSHFLVEADVQFIPVADGLRSVRFDLINQLFTAGRKAGSKAKNLKLLKVVDPEGKELPFIHRKNNVIVLLSQPLVKGNDTKLHFSMNEETITQLSSVHYLVLNTYPWFPQHGYLGGRAAIDWTIKAKKPLFATGSGRRVRDEPEGPYNVTQLVFDTEVSFPSLLFGQYQKMTDTYTPEAGSGGKNVDLTVYWWPNTEFFVMDAEPPQSVSVTVPGGKSKDVLNEAKQILKFGESLYGPFPYSTLNVAQMSPGLGFGQAPPGLIQLTGEAFMSSSQIASFADTVNADFFHRFFAHEIGHQWWGHVITWAADEDVWLSESFAEYTAGLYVMGLLGQDGFQGKLKDWRDGARLADAAAPIAWANNLSGTNSIQWRRNLLYDKGPYVVHMLRMQVGHENFVKAMKSLTAKYRFKPITTDALRQEFEAAAGYKLDFFFNQWFRGTGIPEFDVATEVKQSEDGKWVATVRTSQRDKSRLKIVNMPIFFHFGKDKMVVKERPILKAEDVYQIKLPEKPQRISVDDYKTLLADIYLQDPSGQ